MGAWPLPGVPGAIRRGRERDRELETSMREKHQSAASCTPPTGDVPTTRKCARHQGFAQKGFGSDPNDGSNSGSPQGQKATQRSEEGNAPSHLCCCHCQQGKPQPALAAWQPTSKACLCLVPARGSAANPRLAVLCSLTAGGRGPAALCACCPPHPGWAERYSSSRHKECQIHALEESCKRPLRRVHYRCRACTRALLPPALLRPALPRPARAFPLAATLLS
ncbi:hypothetical protein QTO34_016733, partial [Cnephaeus nilssonii]